MIRTLARLAPAMAGALALALTLSSPVGAAGMITARDTGAFLVGDEAGYPAGHTFTASIDPGTTVDSGIARLPNGASFGWHYHTAPVVVTIVSGSITLYTPGCDRQVVSAGQGFIEEPGVVHLARNEGHALVVLAWTYLGVPSGLPEDVYLPSTYDPCNGIQ